MQIQQKEHCFLKGREKRGQKAGRKGERERKGGREKEAMQSRGERARHAYHTHSKLSRGHFLETGKLLLETGTLKAFLPPQVRQKPNQGECNCSTFV